MSSVPRLNINMYKLERHHLLLLRQTASHTVYFSLFTLTVAIAVCFSLINLSLIFQCKLLVEHTLYAQLGMMCKRLQKAHVHSSNWINMSEFTPDKFALRRSKWKAASHQYTRGWQELPLSDPFLFRQRAIKMYLKVHFLLYEK